MEQIKSIDKSIYKVVQEEIDNTFYLHIIDKAVAKESGDNLTTVVSNPEHPSRLCSIRTKDLALYDKIVKTLNNLI